MQLTQEYAFYGHQDTFSARYPSPFCYKGLEFQSVEQFVMYSRAVLFADNELAEEILLSEKSSTGKSIKREPADFDLAAWDLKAPNILAVACREKFSQTPLLLEDLMKTGSRVIVGADGDSKLDHALTRAREVLLGQQLSQPPSAPKLKLIGVDEVGTGCIAGPVVSVAYYFNQAAEIPDGLTDSKQLTEAKRAGLLEPLYTNGFAGVGVLDNIEIDRLNIRVATHQAMRMALEGLNIPRSDRIQYGVVIDGNVLPDIADMGWGQVICEPKADANYPAVSAASVIAKEHRDQVMVDLAKDYPEYGFDQHVGYGTPNHMAVLKEIGPCALHRCSFAPVAQVIKDRNPKSKRKLKPA